MTNAAPSLGTRWCKSPHLHYRAITASPRRGSAEIAAFAEDASRIRKNPYFVARLRSFAYNLIKVAGCDNIRNAGWRAALDVSRALEMPGLVQN